MTQKKLFLLEYKEQNYYCSTIAAVLDVCELQQIPLAGYKLHQFKKEFGVKYEFGEVSLIMLPLFVHSNPNKGGDRTATIQYNS